MSDIRIYLYSNCTSCQKAEAHLQLSGLSYQRREIFKERMSPDEIRSLLAEIGKSPFEMLSKRSIPYRQLDLGNRDLTEQELIELMSEHPALLRRPIVVAGDRSIVGYKQSEMEQLIADAGAK